jgi:hypothetical protein
MLRAKEQIEYYLSAVNLDRDSFMRSQVQSTSENFISVSIFMNCNRIKQLGISADDLLFACSHSPFLEVDLTTQSIRPKTPYRRDSRRKQKTVRISGFIQTETAASIFEMLSALTKPPQNVLLQYRQTDAGDRVFTGTATIVYFTETDAVNACETPLFCGDKKLTIESMDSYERRLRCSTNKTVN